MSPIWALLLLALLLAALLGTRLLKHRLVAVAILVLLLLAGIRMAILPAKAGQPVPYTGAALVAQRVEIWLQALWPVAGAALVAQLFARRGRAVVLAGLVNAVALAFSYPGLRGPALLQAFAVTRAIAVGTAAPALAERFLFRKNPVGTTGSSLDAPLLAAGLPALVLVLEQLAQLVATWSADPVQNWVPNAETISQMGYGALVLTLGMQALIAATRRSTS